LLQEQIGEAFARLPVGDVNLADFPERLKQRRLFAALLIKVGEIEVVRRGGGGFADFLIRLGECAARSRRSGDGRGRFEQGIMVA
jgi:hypothetical protein